MIHFKMIFSTSVLLNIFFRFKLIKIVFHLFNIKRETLPEYDLDFNTAQRRAMKI